MTDDPPVLLRRDGPVAVISFNRPDRHNAAGDAMDAAFFSILEQLHESDDVRAIVLRGEGKSFSSGRDTTELGARPPGMSDYEFIERGHAKTRLLLTMPAPIVVALKGWVIGGSFERALLCDMRIAAEDARMRLPEVRYGVIPDSAGVARLFQMAGHGVASDLVLTGRVMDAAEALSHGIVSRVVPTDQLDDTVLEIAHAIAGMPRLAVKLARSTIASLGHDQVLRTLHEELLAQTAVMASDEYKELRAARLRDT
jgi:enoyl-CoA hydratase/carnithine racemase